MKLQIPKLRGLLGPGTRHVKASARTPALVTGASLGPDGKVVLDVVAQVTVHGKGARRLKRRLFGKDTAPTCHGCGSELQAYADEVYCPECTSYAPAG
jgi:hypothetical protein